MVTAPNKSEGFVVSFWANESELTAMHATKIEV